MHPSIFDRIESFNQMYGLPCPDKPTVPTRERLVRFKEILQDELDEVDEVLRDLDERVDPITTITSVADWLGDLIVYCASEAMKCGIPIEEVLGIIMDSNASKLGADGKAIVENGKVQKGPNYWKPEPKIKELLLGRMR